MTDTVVSRAFNGWQPARGRRCAMPSTPREAAHVASADGICSGVRRGWRRRGRCPWSSAPGTPSAASHPTLRTGSHGAAVLALQRRLTSLGYWLGAADGAFGDLTRQAVVAVQKVAGLARDGVCGPATWARVDAGVRPAAHTTKEPRRRDRQEDPDPGPGQRRGRPVDLQHQHRVRAHVPPGRQGPRRRDAVRGLPGLPPGRRLGRRPSGQALPAAVLQRRHRRPRLPGGALDTCSRTAAAGSACRRWTSSGAPVG